MINLRYHIVSITAVFLALAIGIAMGSTFIDKATVDQLKRNIDGVEAKANRVDAENSRLRGQLSAFLDADRELVTNGLPTLLAGSLSDVPVVLITGLDVSDDTVKQVQALVLAAGADFAGTLRLDDRLRKLAPQSDDASKLAAILGTTGTDPPKLLHELASQLGGLLALLSHREAPAAPGSTISSTTTAVTSTTVAGQSAPPTTAGGSTHLVSPPLLQQLISGGFVDFDPPSGEAAAMPRLVAPGQRVIVLGAPRSAPPAGSLDLNAALLVPALEAATRTAGLEVVAASSLSDATDSSDASTRSLFVAPLRADKAVAGRLSTVDDLEGPNGLLALIWAVQETAAGRYGQYGAGSDATAALPKVSPAGQAGH